MSARIFSAVFPTDVSGTLTSDGSEQTLIETGYSKPHQLTGQVDMSALEAADAITVNFYFKLKDGGSWVKYASAPYSGVQSLPGLSVNTRESNFGVKITLQRTAGTDRDYDYNFVLKILPSI